MNIKGYLQKTTVYNFRSIMRRLALITVFTVGLTLFMMYFVDIPPGINIYVDIIGVVLAFLVVSEFIVLLDLYLEYKEPLSFNNITRRISMQFGFSWGFTIFVFLVLFFTFYDKRFLDDENFVLASSFFILTMLLLFTCVSFISILIRVFRTWIELNKEMESLKLEKMELKYKALQDQLNPHFFFNNLSALKSLILLKEERSALRFIQDFSSICRYVLQKSDWITVSVAEDVEFTKQYFELQKIRNEDGLEMMIDIPDEYMEKEIPPMAIQLLVENAIKHNIATEEQMLRIRIEVEGEYMVIRNNLQRKATYHSTGKGLSNLKRRFAHLTSLPVRIEQDDKEFEVFLPII
ncbi:sensor histidine kinase [Aureibacter tunicatorum]|uniref:Sensor histidine kinase YesM n=1 Tax=Aureibacter tunicatorum TaxID=866807 RepID=A0AAE3XLT3_9BACT|nr:histidine kinase [Aureibacter tunicatorum]MDR6238938.1 sensor histidine kinase YesM [Aureibacter tunicatorum]BDD05136.1 histidine kinase [Aureibacter tunicatorum]